MNDSLLVSGMEGVANLGGTLQRRCERQGAGEGRALDALHDQVVGANVVQGANVGVVQGSNGVGFAFETLGELVARNFDGDDAIQRVSRALWTSPIPPAPSGAVIS